MPLSTHTRTKLNDFATWWNWHSDKVSSYPLERQVEWMLRALNSQNEILFEMAREVDNQRESRIALPRNYQWATPK